MNRVDVERRVWCRTCGRGRDAPHRPDCTEGRVRAARESFSVVRLARDLNAKGMP